MRLNNIQNSAITLLENHLGEQPITSWQSNPDEQAALKNIQNYQVYQMRSQRVGASQSPMMTASFSEDIISTLPILMTPEVKKHLQTLDSYSKLGDTPTAEQNKEATEAYRAIGKSIKVAIMEKVIGCGIREGLAEAPYVGPFASVIASIAAKPLAEMAASLSNNHIKLQHRLINLALRMLGKEPISIDDHDLFMAKAIGKFAGGILGHAEQEAASGFRGDKSRLRGTVNNIA